MFKPARGVRALPAAVIAVAAMAGPAQAQVSFKVADRDVQVHGFGSQAFVKTDHNNFLTMKTGEGSAELSDAGLNASSQITRRLRAGAQLYVRNVGKLDNWGVKVDWAFVDYRFTDVLGVRAGKVKTVLGLYNDTQDNDALHTWALLPQSVYPADLRGDTIAHVGADLYGRFGVRHLGTFSYTAYAGKRPTDLEGGFARAQSSDRVTLADYEGNMVGGDLRWTTPVSGLTIGGSFLEQDVKAHGTRRARRSSTAETPWTLTTKIDQTMGFYSQYQLGGLRVDGEYRRSWRVTDSHRHREADIRSAFGAVAYRLTNWLEVGAYHSRFYNDFDEPPAERAEPDEHIFDNVFTARLDLASFWVVKVEGHFMDGYGNARDAHGFYDARAAMKPKTRALIVRTGVAF